MNPYSCVQTVELLRKLALNVHGVIDVVDDKNCDEIIELLKRQDGYKEPEQKPFELPLPWLKV